MTVRGFDPRVELEIHRLSRQEGISLNQAALRLLAKGAGVPGPEQAMDRVGAELDRFFGTWSKKDADDFEAGIAELERIDESLWR